MRLIDVIPVDIANSVNVAIALHCTCDHYNSHKMFSYACRKIVIPIYSMHSKLCMSMQYICIRYNACVKGNRFTWRL